MNRSVLRKLSPHANATRDMPDQQIEGERLDHFLTSLNISMYKLLTPRGKLLHKTNIHKLTRNYIHYKELL